MNRMSIVRVGSSLAAVLLIGAASARAQTPGTYTLSFTLGGFKKTVRSGVVINSGVELRVDRRPSGGTFTKTIVTRAVPPPPHPCGVPR
jgi:hypothetical protein